MDDGGEIYIVLYNGVNFDNYKEFVESVFDRFDENDILVLQNEINVMDYITDKAYKKDLQILLNPSPITEAKFCLKYSFIFSPLLRVFVNCILK